MTQNKNPTWIVGTKDYQLCLEHFVNQETKHNSQLWDNGGEM